MKRLILAIAAIIGAVTAVPAFAWENHRSEGQCIVGQEFEGPGDSTFVIVWTKGTYAFGLNNNNWSPEVGKRYDDIVLVLIEPWSDEIYGITNGFAAKVPRDFVDEFAKAKSLYVYRSKTRIDRLSLSGSAPAIAKFRACIRAESKFADLPVNPFAE